MILVLLWTPTLNAAAGPLDGLRALSQGNQIRERSAEVALAAQPFGNGALFSRSQPQSVELWWTDGERAVLLKDGPNVVLRSITPDTALVWLGEFYWLEALTTTAPVLQAVTSCQHFCRSQQALQVGEKLYFSDIGRHQVHVVDPRRDERTSVEVTRYSGLFEIGDRLVSWSTATQRFYWLEPEDGGLAETPGAAFVGSRVVSVSSTPGGAVAVVERGLHVDFLLLQGESASLLASVRRLFDGPEVWQSESTGQNTYLAANSERHCRLFRTDGTSQGSRILVIFDSQRCGTLARDPVSQVIAFPMGTMVRWLDPAHPDTVRSLGGAPGALRRMDAGAPSWLRHGYWLQYVSEPPTGRPLLVVANLNSGAAAFDRVRFPWIEVWGVPVGDQGSLRFLTLAGGLPHATDLSGWSLADGRLGSHGRVLSLPHPDPSSVFVKAVAAGTAVVAEEREHGTPGPLRLVRLSDGLFEPTGFEAPPSGHLLSAAGGKALVQRTGENTAYTELLAVDPADGSSSPLREWPGVVASLPEAARSGPADGGLALLNFWPLQGLGGFVVTNGTRSGTTAVGGGRISFANEVAGRLVWSASSSDTIWTATPSGERTPLFLGQNSSVLGALDGEYYIWGFDPAAGRRLIYAARPNSDLREVFRLAPGFVSGDPGNWGIVRRYLYWVQQGADQLLELPQDRVGELILLREGATGVTSFQGIGGVRPGSAVAHGGRLYFERVGSERGLWTTDGTVAGTYPVLADAAVDPGRSWQKLAAVDGQLLFSAEFTFESREPVLTNGMRDGGQVMAINPGPRRSAPALATVAGDDLFLIASRLGDGREAYAMARQDLRAACQAAAHRLCLRDGRFSVEVRWWDLDGGTGGRGNAIPLDSSDSGAFSFFEEDNLELIVKVLDGGGVNGADWVFYGGLTTLDADITVIDHWSGQESTYRRSFGDTCGGSDIAAFRHSGVDAPWASWNSAVFDPSRERSEGTVATRPSELVGTCGSAACLQSGRFRAHAEVRLPTGEWLEATPRFTTDSSLTWSVFEPDNLELLLKVIDGQAVNGSWWVFLGKISDLETRVTVTDTADGEQQTYHLPAGDLCGATDLLAFHQDG